MARLQKVGFLLTLVIGASISAQTLEPGLTVRLSVAKTKFSVGEPIYVTVKITNVGKQDIFVGRRIPINTDWIYSLVLSLQDQKGNASTMLWRARDPVPPDPEESLASALAKAWVALPPGYSYSTAIEIDSETFAFLKKPGRYRLSGTYQSMGMDAPLYYNALLNRPEEMKKLPYRSWEGEVDTNSVWLEIVPRTMPEKRK
jgi:hypothetical protein